MAYLFQAIGLLSLTFAVFALLGRFAGSAEGELNVADCLLIAAVSWAAGELCDIRNMLSKSRVTEPGLEPPGRMLPRGMVAIMVCELIAAIAFLVWFLR